MALSKYRIDKAKEDYSAACILYEAGEYRPANNRAYYSIFHSLRAVLALDEYDSKKHSGIIAEFRKRYIKTGIFSKEISDAVRDAFEIRNSSDYEDMYIVNKVQTKELIDSAEYVLNKIVEYLKNEKVIINE